MLNVKWAFLEIPMVGLTVICTCTYLPMLYVLHDVPCSPVLLLPVDT